MWLGLIWFAGLSMEGPPLVRWENSIQEKGGAIVYDVKNAESLPPSVSWPKNWTVSYVSNPGTDSRQIWAIPPEPAAYTYVNFEPPPPSFHQRLGTVVCSYYHSPPSRLDRLRKRAPLLRKRFDVPEEVAAPGMERLQVATDLEIDRSSLKFVSSGDYRKAIDASRLFYYELLIDAYLALDGTYCSEISRGDRTVLYFSNGDFQVSDEVHFRVYERGELIYEVSINRLAGTKPAEEVVDRSFQLIKRSILYFGLGYTWYGD